MIDEVNAAWTLPQSHKCPHCGESYYSVLYSTSTCLHYTPVYKDGVLISKNPNKTTNHCKCLNCSKKFSYQSQHWIVDKVGRKNFKILPTTLKVICYNVNR